MHWALAVALAELESSEVQDVPWRVGLGNVRVLGLRRRG